MIYQFIFAIFLGSLLSHFFSYLIDFSGGLHRLCLQMAPLSPFREFYQSIVCGLRIPSHNSINSLKSMGVLHILVVSGAHLLFLNRLLKQISFGKLSTLLQMFILFFFVCCTQLQLPAFRAWLVLLIVFLNKKLKLFNAYPTCLLLSVVFCISLVPESYQSLSIPMSWLASLAIFLGRNSFTQSVLCYFFLFPIFMNWQALNPWSIAINAFITPFICLILFPLSLFSFLFESLSLLTDLIWQTLFFLSHKGQTFLTSPAVNPIDSQNFFYWIYPATLNLLLIYKKRERHFS